VREEES
jgi:hypothetical protein